MESLGIRIAHGLTFIGVLVSSGLTASAQRCSVLEGQEILASDDTT